MSCRGNAVVTVAAAGSFSPLVPFFYLSPYFICPDLNFTAAEIRLQSQVHLNTESSYFNQDKTNNCSCLCVFPASGLLLVSKHNRPALDNRPVLALISEISVPCERQRQRLQPGEPVRIQLLGDVARLTQFDSVVLVLGEESKQYKIIYDHFDDGRVHCCARRALSGRLGVLFQHIQIRRL